MSFSEKWVSKFQIKAYSWVFVPTDEVKQYGLHVKKLIEKRWHSPVHYYHLCSGGHIKAIQQHLSHRYFLHLDIQDFFGHINRSRVTRCLKEYMSYDEARDIAIQSTVRLPGLGKKYILPFGFVQSPIVASLCLSKSALGRQINRLSIMKDHSVSVYMDDIIVSSDDLDALNCLLRILHEAADRSGLPFNDEKQEGPCEKVTAFNICMSQGYLEITSSRLEEMLNAYAHSDNDVRRAGILNYVKSVNPAQADIMLSETSSIAE